MDIGGQPAQQFNETMHPASRLGSPSTPTSYRARDTPQGVSGGKIVRITVTQAMFDRAPTAEHAKQEEARRRQQEEARRRQQEEARRRQKEEARRRQKEEACVGGRRRRHAGGELREPPGASSRARAMRPLSEERYRERGGILVDMKKGKNKNNGRRSRRRNLGVRPAVVIGDAAFGDAVIGEPDVNFYSYYMSDASGLSIE